LLKNHLANEPLELQPLSEMDNNQLEGLISYFSDESFENGKFKIKQNSVISPNIRKVIANVFIDKTEAPSDQIYNFEIFYLISFANKSAGIVYIMRNGSEIHWYLKPEFRSKKILFHELPTIISDLFLEFKSLQLTIDSKNEFYSTSRKLAEAYGFKRIPVKTRYYQDKIEEFYELSKIRFKRSLEKTANIM
jgi:hypothetical protein